MASKYGDNPKCSMIRSANTLGLLVATNMRRPDDLRPESGGYAGIQFVLVDTGFCKAFSIEQQRVLRFLSAAQQLFEASEERGAMHQMRSSAVGTGRPSSLSACWMDLVIPSLGSDKVPSRSKQITFMESSPPQSSHGVMSAVFAISRRVRSTSGKGRGSAANRRWGPMCGHSESSGNDLVAT